MKMLSEIPLFKEYTILKALGKLDKAKETAHKILRCYDRNLDCYSSLFLKLGIAEITFDVEGIDNANTSYLELIEEEKDSFYVKLEYARFLKHKAGQPSEAKKLAQYCLENIEGNKYSADINDFDISYYYREFRDIILQ